MKMGSGSLLLLCLDGKAGVVLWQDVLGKILTEGPLSEAKTSTGGWEEAPSVLPPLVRSDLCGWGLPFAWLILLRRIQKSPSGHSLCSRCSSALWTASPIEHVKTDLIISSLNLFCPSHSRLPQRRTRVKASGPRCYGLGSSLARSGEQRHSFSFSRLLAPPRSLLSLLRSKAPLSNVLSAHHEW